ncbi:MAG: hypothetical protein CYPHOPRED_002390 [Cyphobasidiales sp. Tagirdzhanova-0007]|nr:MAG: hypothetical protein CYPHOPRED_002390 [Cyphobasidiales sp. Tagirdzhanova-0007]
MANSIHSQSIRQRPVAAKSFHRPSEHQERDIIATFTPPAFTVKDLLGAIPKHCYERSALRSASYLVGDLAMLAAFAYLATFIDSLFGSTGSLVEAGLGRIIRVILWVVYAICAGSVATGVWIIAHECGHQAFSTSKTLNNTVGWIFHSALLVPYHSWRISHARHHAATGSMERDEVFVPRTRSELGIKPESQVVEESTFEKMDELFEDAPLWSLINVVLQQTFGWLAYLFWNASGQNYGKWTSHFDPQAPIFDARHSMQVIASDVGLLIVGSVLTLWGMQRGFSEVARYYLIPYLIVNHHLVLITFLQHTDPLLPHYRKSEWNFQRGALCTIDRNLFGSIGAYVFHGICETHVAHHVCSKIPHYNAWEATEALKEILGDHYMKSDDNMYKSLYNNHTQCKFVEDTGSCVFYKNKLGKAQRVVVYEEDSGVDVRDVTVSEEEEI